MTRWRPIRTDNTNTIDQHLLAEIRDELRARPLAYDIGKSEIDLARKILAQQDELDAKISRLAGLTQFLLRTQGIDGAALSDDEIDLLVDVGAMERVGA